MQESRIRFSLHIGAWTWIITAYLEPSFPSKNDWKIANSPNLGEFPNFEICNISKFGEILHIWVFPDSWRVFPANCRCLNHRTNTLDTPRSHSQMVNGQCSTYMGMTRIFWYRNTIPDHGVSTICFLISANFEVLDEIPDDSQSESESEDEDTDETDTEEDD